MVVRELGGVCEQARAGSREVLQVLLELRSVREQDACSRVLPQWRRGNAPGMRSVRKSRPDATRESSHNGGAEACTEVRRAPAMPQ